MRIYFLLRLVLIFLLCVFAIASHAQEGEETFDYTKTVWIVDVIDGKGIIYARPNFDDYNARQGFIYIYELLLKYIDKLPENQSINSAVSSTPTHHLIYINGVSQQRITIGEYWLSDERKVTLMDEDDYRNLKAWLESRRKIENYKKNSSPDEILRVFRKNISLDVESFTEYFKLNLASSSAANSSSSLAKSVSSLSIQRHISESSSSSSSSSVIHQSGTSSSVISGDAAQVHLGVKDNISIKESIVNKGTANKAAEVIIADDKQEQVSASEESSSISGWIIAMGLLLGALLVG